MASSSSSSFSFPSSSLSGNWEHDVFPSFHGPDVRKTFLSHFVKEIRRKAINLFIDNEIERGEFIGSELKRAIRGSKISVVVLSKNYASSSWCLDEVVEIMKQEFVITIFYEVDPTDIKKQTGDFGEVFNKTCKGKDKKQTDTWRKALEDVATIAGYHSSKWFDEAIMIEDIASNISKKLNRLTPSRDFDNLIGMEYHMQMMKLLFCQDLDDVRMIGIWGPLGIGKTTIARFLFDQVSSNFQNSAFVVNIKGSYRRTCSDGYSAQLQLQEKMLSQMVNQKDIVISHLGVAQRRLGNRKVLLVLDDVDQLAQLYALAEDIKWFGPKSRVIITTEDRRLLEAHGVDLIYKVKFPSIDEALKMFCMYAFDQKSPKDGFDVLAHEITYLVGNLPLGLQVMGSYFRGLSKQKWSMEVSRLRTKLNGEIESILMFSYDALCEEEKNLFLHIACLFNHEYMEKVEEYLAESFMNLRQGLDVLKAKSLISIDTEYIVMHKLLAQLGKEIVRKQSVLEPGKRQFLLDYKDIYEVLTDYSTVPNIVLGINSKYESNTTEKFFERMYNLQFLRVRSDSGHSNIKSSLRSQKYKSSKLRLLDWSFFPMTCLPFTANMEFLVELKMIESNLEKLWDEIKLLQNVKWIDLSYSRNLKKLPNFSMATSLKELNLRECSSLVKLPSSIGNATNLQKLYLGGCSSLVELPSSIGNASNLHELNLEGCSKLVKLPSSIGSLRKLLSLNLKGCSKLKALPININMESLDSLDLTNCSLLQSFPEISTNIALRKLKLDGCSSLKELPSSIGNASNLQELNLEGCSNLVTLPSSIGNLRKLPSLSLKGCSKLKTLPININMVSVGELVLSDCLLLQSFPEISTNIALHKLKLDGCSSLKELPSSIGNASNLQELNLEGCSNLVKLPSSIRSLRKLLSLNLKGCSKLKALPININMESLNSLDMTDCSLIQNFPEISTNIEYLGLIGTSIKEVRCSIRLLSRLNHMHMSYSENLKEFPFIHNSITKLRLSDTTIQELGPWVRGLSHLNWLEVKGMQKLVSLPQLPDSLEFLDAENCESLERLDCSFGNPNIRLNFVNCFKLNQEARDLIIHTSTHNSVVLPGGKMPECFAYRAYGSSVKVKWNQNSYHPSTNFKACMLFDYKGENEAPNMVRLSCYMRPEHNALTSCHLSSVMKEHLYIFDIEARNIISREQVFEFELDEEIWEIKECGILLHLEHHFNVEDDILENHVDEEDEILENLVNVEDKILKEHVDLSGCSSLVEIPSSIKNLTNLKRLDLDGCSSLVELPSSTGNATNHKISNSESLEKLDSSFCNQDFCLKFINCFKLNQKAKEVPGYFTYRAYGSSVTVKLNQMPLPTSITRFKACILFDDKGVGVQGEATVSYCIHFKQNALTARRSDYSDINSFVKEHLCIFDIYEAGVTSTELVFEFEHLSILEPSWEIKECGILLKGQTGSNHLFSSCCGGASC